MKFSEAISWSVVFWRSTSPSMRANSSVSRVPGQVMGWVLLGSRCSVRVGDVREERVEIGVLGGRVAEARFEPGQLVDAALVPTALERGGEPQLGDLLGEPVGDDAGPHREHVGVVVLPGHACGVEVVAQRGAHACDLVGRELLALAAAAEHDATFGATGGHRPADQRAEDRVVDGLVSVGAQVEDLVAIRRERRREDAP